jgi:6-pyruvoyl-tetrahydropterin synthase
VLAPRITDPGWVLDYGDLAPFGAYLDSVFDHQWLGAGALFDDVGGGKTLPVLYTELAADPSAGSTGISSNPTAENLAAWFRWWLTTPGNLPALAPVMAPPGSYVRPVSVEAGVSETPKTWAWAR